MLEFIRKIFRNEEEGMPPVMEVSLQSLGQWLDEKSKPLREDAGQHAEEILMRVNDEIQRTRVNIEVLENAKLHNENIPFKAKQYMEGNRKAYARAISSFLGHMEINNKDYFYLLDFCGEFDKLLDELNSGTLRSYSILQEFFANETSKIAENLRNFDSCFKELRAVLNDGRLAASNKLKEKAKDLEAKTKQQINMVVDFRNIEAAVKLANNEKDAIMEDIERFDKSDDHNNFLKLKEEEKVKKENFYDEESAIMRSFAVLERPLRKYSHIAFEHEEAVLNYLGNPIDALANDRGMAIIGILKNMGNMLEENKLQIDEKKKEKALEEVKKLDNEFLQQFLKKYHSFRSEIEEIEKKVEMSGVAEKFRGFNKNLEDANLRIERNTQEYGRVKQSLDSLSMEVEALKSDVENSIKELFGHDVKLVA